MTTGLYDDDLDVNDSVPIPVDDKHFEPTDEERLEAEGLRRLFNERIQAMIEAGVASPVHLAGPKRAVRVFYDLASICRELGECPRRYMTKRFDFSRPHPIRQTQLLSYGDKKNEACVRFLLENCVDENFEVSLSSQLEAMRSQCVSVSGSGSAAVDAVTCPDQNVSPLLRYSLAVRFGLKRAAAMYRDEAVHQFRLNPQKYRESWQSVLPPEFMEARHG